MRNGFTFLRQKALWPWSPVAPPLAGKLATGINSVFGFAGFRQACPYSAKDSNCVVRATPAKLVATRGFTLIEILVVVLIISILAGIVGWNVLRHPGEAKVAAAKLEIKTFKSVLQMYRMEQGRYPTQEQGLQALCTKPTAVPVPEHYPAEGYLESRKVPKDPWGHDYVYLSPGRNQEPYEVISYGNGGEPGGTGEAADISSSDL